jgi:hypothetical protein
MKFWLIVVVLELVDRIIGIIKDKTRKERTNKNERDAR